MKSILTATAVGICAFAALQNIQAQTDFTEPLSICLTATYEGSAGTNDGVATQSVITTRLTSDDVISALGTSLGMSFTGHAELLLTEASNGLTVAIQDGTNPPVDVSPYFAFNASSNTVASVSAFSFRMHGPIVTSNVFGIETFALQNASTSNTVAWHFDVSGLTDATTTVFDAGGTNSATRFSLKADVAGTGDYNGQFAVFQGSISAGSFGFDEFPGPRGGFGGGDGGGHGNGGGDGGGDGGGRGR